MRLLSTPSGMLISALFWVLMPWAPILFMAVCILTIGNLMYFLQTLLGLSIAIRLSLELGDLSSFFLRRQNDNTAVPKLALCTDGRPRAAV